MVKQTRPVYKIGTFLEDSHLKFRYDFGKTNVPKYYDKTRLI